MKRNIFILGLLLMFLPVLALGGGVDRVEISPSAMVNLAEGHTGAMMGGALNGDIFLTASFALRTTIGFTKLRYYPSELDYADADYSFWLSFAPYMELNIGNRWRPYLALTGSFGSGDYNMTTMPVAGFEQAPFTRIQPVTTRNNFYSLGGTLGSKFRLFGPLSAFVEASYYFYSHFSNRGTFYMTGYPYLDQAYHFEENPAYLSFGLTYQINLK
ncbi:MAG: hypothetical protein PHU88_00680 [candidate division Zixibacteria bacterium]|nr:hypothetical protein [candidate division Zixibacteria bacterium]MDD5426049.1 hypothetical protein [candidate division Zixibacteria bacterium]